MKAKQGDPEGMDIATFMERMKSRQQADREEMARLKQETRDLRAKKREWTKQIKRLAQEYDRRMGVSTEQPGDKVQVTYYDVNNFNVTADLPSRNIHLYLWWWNEEDYKKPDFEQQLDVACHIGRTVEDIIRHMRINGHEVDYVETDEVEG